jgi:hypothetical protein
VRLQVPRVPHRRQGRRVGRRPTDRPLRERAVGSPIAAAVLLLEQSGCDIELTEA